MSRQRICVVSEEYPAVSDYFGGIGTQYGAFAPAWAAAGAEVHVITSRPRGAVAPAMVEGVNVHALPRGRAAPWVALDRGRRVRSELGRLGRFDAIIAPEFRGEASLYAPQQHAGPLVTHLLTSTAQLLSLRPGLTALERHGPRTRLYLRLERRQAENSRALFGAGQAVLDWAQSLWPGIRSAPARVLPLAIRVDQVRDQAREGDLPSGFPPGDAGIRVGLASRLDGHKGADVLLAAMQQVWSVNPEARLVYIGRDARYRHANMSDHLRALAGKHADRVHFTGALPSAQYFAAVAACDIVAIPSLWESFCLAAVEAMALRRPVIGTRGHGFDEYLRDGENGLLVDRGDVESLAAALRRLQDDAGLRARLGAAASDTAEQLDVPRVAARYLEAFREL